MPRPKITEYDGITDATVEREMNDAEYAQHLIDVANPSVGLPAT